MPKLLVNPLEPNIVMAISDGHNILAQSQSSCDQKPEALEEAYRNLPSNLPFDEIVMVNGPGNFTALRVGLGFVRGLALGYNVPTRGITIFDVDYRLNDDCPKDAKLYRDARGGKYYEATFSNGLLQGVILVENFSKNGMSAEPILGLKTIKSDLNSALHALAKSAEQDIGDSPAKANYIRPPNAALPSEPPLVILNG